MKKTSAELVQCARRELAMRKKVYIRRVAEGKMSRDTALHEIECMEQIVELLDELDEPRLEL